jgi:hypothetical protein
VTNSPASIQAADPASSPSSAISEADEKEMPSTKEGKRRFFEYFVLLGTPMATAELAWNTALYTFQSLLPFSLAPT